METSKDKAQGGPRERGGQEAESPRAAPFAPPEYDAANTWPVPSPEQCREYWDLFLMPEHIRRHSTMVGHVAEVVAKMAMDAGAMAARVNVDEVVASALLHDLAKAYTIRYGGQHAALGGAWVQELTGNPAVAQGVMHHVWWPFETDPQRYFLPLTVLYADKRVRHDTVVSLGARYSDLFERYGKTPRIIERMKDSLAQARALEEALGKLVGENLHACDFGGRRLVQ